MILGVRLEGKGLLSTIGLTGGAHGVDKVEDNGEELPSPHPHQHKMSLSKRWPLYTTWEETSIVQYHNQQ